MTDKMYGSDAEVSNRGLLIRGLIELAKNPKNALNPYVYQTYLILVTMPALNITGDHSK